MRGFGRLPGPASLLAALLSAGAAVPGCDDVGDSDPCAYVTCSSRGFCTAVAGRPTCRCLDGYHAVELECVADAPFDADADADGDEGTGAELGADADAEAADAARPCTYDTECEGTDVCRDGFCTRRCETSADCGPGQECVALLCEPAVCTASSDCETTLFCDVHACTAGAAGECVFEPSECPAVYEPECGCDGVSYSSRCERVRAGTALDHAGECSP
jgi:hypothetical protein